MISESRVISCFAQHYRGWNIMKFFAAFLFVVLILGRVHGLAQTYDLQFVEVQNTGSVFDVKLQIKSTGGTFRMGSGNLVFTYSTVVLGVPAILTPHNFSGGFYSPMAVTLPAVGRVSVNIEYNSAAGQGTVVPSAYLDVVTLRFPISDLTGNGLLQWRTVTPNRTNVFQDDNSTLVTAGALHNLDEPLPIQLSSFTGSVMDPGMVLLEWSTLTETNNYGFEIEKGNAALSGYATLANSFVPGYGTSGVPREYAFVDSSAGEGTWYYRLRQIDLDGTVHYTGGIRVDVLTGVTERVLPAEFALDQNYPNPFNPGTAIAYALPRASHVRLEVFTLLGERVATLVDETKQAGYHVARFDGSALASGIYFYRLAAGDLKMMKRMLLVK
jgi:hypothetical protein